jgi:hypothetical protein
MIRLSFGSNCLARTALLIATTSLMSPLTYGDNPDVDLWPSGEINDSATPSVSWSCTSDSAAMLTLYEKSSGKVIRESPWSPIEKSSGSRCSVKGHYLLGKKIVPPAKPYVCPYPNCIRYATPQHGGLPPGGYTLSLGLRSPEGKIAHYETKFEIISNIYSSFSDSDGWKILNNTGNWEAMGGQYRAQGNTLGQPWISLYRNNVFKGRNGHKFYDGRLYEVRMSPNCFNDRCFAGVVTGLSVSGETNGIARYWRREVIVTGEQKLYIRLATSSNPDLYVEELSGVNVSEFISGKASYTLKVYLSGQSAGSVYRVYIDNAFVRCGLINNEVSGPAGLVFSSREDFESIDIDEFLVWPNPNPLPCFWELPYVPINK